MALTLLLGACASPPPADEADGLAAPQPVAVAVSAVSSDAGTVGMGAAGGAPSGAVAGGATGVAGTAEGTSKVGSAGGAAFGRVASTVAGGTPRAQTCVPRWRPQRLPGKIETRYTLEAGNRSVRAQAAASASLLRHALRVEPAELGALAFSWKVPALTPGADVRQRHTEDAAARLVLAFEGDAARLSARNQALFELAAAVTGERPPFATLMYVWDASAPVGEVITNPRTDRIRKIVLESGSAHLNQWRSYRRDIAADFQAAYGEPPGALVAVALMTDADNTGGEALAWYGPVCLEPAPRAP